MDYGKIMKNKKRYALVSTYNKNNLLNICKVFKKFNIEIISTGTTAKKINELGFNCLLVSDLTNFKEILDGRVKTLHPKIHASLLYDRTNPSHIKTFNKLDFPSIDFVIINLYPFKETSQNTKNFKKCIEMIDIGGPAILRSAAKNFKTITTISDPSLYENFIKNLNSNKGFTNIGYRKKMAQVVFMNTSLYDQKISNWFLKNNEDNISLDESSKIALRYGENPNQSAFFYKTSISSIFDFQFHGKQISYNNVLDINAGLDCLDEFSEPTCIIIKHNNPCGVSSRKNISEAFSKALEADPLSAFGGIVLFNRKIDKKIAHKLNKNFFEIIAAPSFSSDSKKILMKKKSILINTNQILVNKKNEIKSVLGGYLLQEKNKMKINKKILKKVSKYNSNFKKIDDLIFALKVCKHVKSNAIVLVNNKQTIGIGAGQMSRIDSTKIAIQKIQNKKKNKNFVAASDAFFPFIDNIKKLNNYGCKAIVQPQGSINDNKIIEYANKKKLSLFFIKNRLFKH